MVQRTMGRPDERRAGPNVGSEQIVWVFRNYSQQTAPREKTGWSEVLSPGIRDQRGNAVQKPVTRDIYYTPVGADIQVTFTDGVVSSVERLKK